MIQHKTPTDESLSGSFPLPANFYHRDGETGWRITPVEKENGRFRQLPAPSGGKGQDTNACHFRESFLILVECQDGVGSHFDGDGDVEKIHPADGNGKAVLGAEFARGANGVPQVEFGVRPVAEADFLFEETDLIAGVSRIDGSYPLRLSKGVEDLDAMPGRPKDFRLWMPVEQGDRCVMACIPARLVGQPPRSVRVNGHFLSPRKNATPSNFGFVGSPTARASASSRVIRGRVLSVALRFGLCAVAFIGVQTYCVRRMWSSGADEHFRRARCPATYPQP